MLVLVSLCSALQYVVQHAVRGRAQIGRRLQVSVAFSSDGCVPAECPGSPCLSALLLVAAACSLRNWLTPLSVLQMLSPLFMKTWRVARIFTESKYAARFRCPLLARLLLLASRVHCARAAFHFLPPRAAREPCRLCLQRVCISLRRLSVVKLPNSTLVKGIVAMFVGQLVGASIARRIVRPISLGAQSCSAWQSLRLTHPNVVLGWAPHRRF